MLIDELRLQFASHACRVHAITAEHAARDREQIVVAVQDTVPYWLGAEAHALNRGAAVFLPRGLDHRVLASSSAPALIFSFALPTWIEMVSSTLLHELAAEPSLRRPAFAPIPAALESARDEAVALLLSAPPPRGAS